MRDHWRGGGSLIVLSPLIFLLSLLSSFNSGPSWEYDQDQDFNFFNFLYLVSGI